MPRVHDSDPLRLAQQGQDHAFALALENLEHVLAGHEVEVVDLRDARERVLRSDVAVELARRHREGWRQRRDVSAKLEFELLVLRDLSHGRAAPVIRGYAHASLGETREEPARAQLLPDERLELEDGNASQRAPSTGADFNLQAGALKAVVSGND